MLPSMIQTRHIYIIKACVNFTDLYYTDWIAGWPMRVHRTVKSPHTGGGHFETPTKLLNAHRGYTKYDVFFNLKRDFTTKTCFSFPPMLFFMSTNGGFIHRLDFHDVMGEHLICYFKSWMPSVFISNPCHSLKPSHPHKPRYRQVHSLIRWITPLLIKSKVYFGFLNFLPSNLWW